VRRLIIGFSRPKKGFKPFSWIIRLVEWTPYSHVYIRSYSVGLDVDLIYQASGAQVNFMGLEMFRSHATIIDEFEVEISDEQYRSFMRWAIINSGADYSIKQILGIALFKMFNLDRNPFKNGTKAWVCAELVEFVLMKFIGVSIDEKELETAGPKKIHEICNSNFKKIAG